MDMHGGREPRGKAAGPGERIELESPLYAEDPTRLELGWGNALMRLYSIITFVLVLFCSASFAGDPPAGYRGASVSRLKTIVIDPGHGGLDTGAVGPSGAEEKDVNLSVALILADILRDRLGCTVLLTRTGDVFVGLEERTAFANGNMADIFISVHSNAALNRSVEGVETYFLSFEATDDDARRLAAMENGPAYAGGRLSPEESGDISAILSDLTRTAAHHDSSRLAESVQSSLLKAAGNENRGVKQAPFMVLSGASMPAILVEVGFITNPVEEKRLSSRKIQLKTAASIAEGVVNFARMPAKGIDQVGLGETAKKN